jgi:hypothetical protein
LVLTENDIWKLHCWTASAVSRRRRLHDAWMIVQKD